MQIGQKVKPNDVPHWKPQGLLRVEQISANGSVVAVDEAGKRFVSSMNCFVEAKNAEIAARNHAR